MNHNTTIDFNNVDQLSQTLRQRKLTKARFKLDIPQRDAANALYAAFTVEVEQRNIDTGRNFVFDDDTRAHILDAASWLIDTSQPPSLLLYGMFGNGKTSLARAIARLVEYVSEQNDYSRRVRTRFLTAKDICRICSVSERFKEQYDDYQSIFNEPFLIIDDMGAEPADLIVYGMIHNPIVDIITHRYDKQLTTIMTSNLTEKELKEKYGQRIYDRLREMAKPILFTNKSYR